MKKGASPAPLLQKLLNNWIELNCLVLRASVVLCKYVQTKKVRVNKNYAHQRLKIS